MMKDLKLKTQQWTKIGDEWKSDRDKEKSEENLTELGLELRVNLIESTAEVRELSASLIGDEDLSHTIPIYSPRRFESHIRDFLTGSAHFLALSRCHPKTHTGEEWRKKKM